MAEYTVIYVDLDVQRNSTIWFPYINSIDSASFDTIEDAQAYVDEIRSDLFRDALIDGSNVQKEYTRFECGPYNW